ncbi:hypothetical protein MBLNU230_g8544t1 [Neophaeotheca triangularis]
MSVTKSRWTWRAEASTITKYSRDYHITASSGTRETNGGQITAGQYIPSVGEWVFPESTRPGTIPPPIDFTGCQHLANGAGPDDDGNIWGPHSPWPGESPPPTPEPCTAPPPTLSDLPSVPTTAPVANAGADLQVRPGVLVTLAAANDPLSGPSVTLEGTNNRNASFVTPRITGTSLTTSQFQLKVSSESNGLSSTDTVTVINDPAAKDTVTIDSFTWTSSRSGTISVVARSNADDARLSLVLNNPNPGTILAMVSQDMGNCSYDSRSVKLPSTGLTVTSNLGGSASQRAPST